MGRKWTVEEIQQLVEGYPAQGGRAIAVKLARTMDSVYSQARKLGLKSAGGRQRQVKERARRSRSVNACFFDESSPAVAYVLGVIWGRGHVRTRLRKVLTFKVAPDRKPVLQRVRGLMHSRHQVQATGDHLLLDVCNSRLVGVMLRAFGRPPGLANPDPPPPRLPDGQVAYFALGLLEAKGNSSPEVVCWQAGPKVIQWLAEFVPRTVNVGAPRRYADSAEHRLAWTRKEDVGRLRAWLDRLAHQLPTV